MPKFGSGKGSETLIPIRTSQERCRIQHGQFRNTSGKCYSNVSTAGQEFILVPNTQLTPEPGLATVVAAKFGDGTGGLLMVDPKERSILPL